MATYYMRADGTAANKGDAGGPGSVQSACMNVSVHNGETFSDNDVIRLADDGGIYRSQLTVPSSGSSGNPIIYEAESGDSPVIDGSDEVTGWTLSGEANIYSATVTWTSNQVYEDSSLLTRVTWDTDIATTAPSMSAGTWTLDDAGDLLYVWATDNADPDTHTMKVSRRLSGIRILGKSFVTIQGITCQYANSYGIDVAAPSATSNNIIDDCDLRYNRLAGFLEFHTTNNHATNIKNCRVHNNGTHGISLGKNSNGSVVEGNTAYTNGVSVEANTPANINLGGTGIANNIVQDNIVYDASPGGDETDGNGIGVDTTGSGNIIRRNVSYGNNRFGIMVEATDGTSVYYNLVYNNSNKAGIIVGRDCSNNNVYNNVSYNNAVGIHIRGTVPSSPPDDMTDNLIKNNICFGNTIELSATHGGENDGTFGSGNVYTYNCFGPESASFIEWGDGVFKSTYDSWETASGNCGSDGCTNSVEADPLFVDAANADFNLTSSSPAIDAGICPLGVTQDYDGNRVPAGDFCDMGAQEYSPFEGTVP